MSKTTAKNSKTIQVKSNGEIKVVKSVSLSDMSVAKTKLNKEERRQKVTVHVSSVDAEKRTAIVSYRYNNVRVAAYEIELPSEMKIVDGNISRADRDVLKQLYHEAVQKEQINIDRELLSWYQISKQGKTA